MFLRLSYFLTGVLLASLAFGVRHVENEVERRKSATLAIVPDVDLDALVRVSATADAGRIRQALATRIWGAGGLDHGAMPDQVEERTAPAFGAWKQFLLHHSNHLGFSYVADLLLAGPDSRHLVVYHLGHGSERARVDVVVPRLLAAGHSVLLLNMPGLGPNIIPQVVRVGADAYVIPGQELHLTTALYECPEYSAIHLFLDHVLRAVNHAVARHRFGDVAMIGISGGGWATMLYAAVDTRISASYPVAGGLPFHLRGAGGWGDWEQYGPDVYRIAGYLDLFLLAASDGRRQLQFFNSRDECCFEAHLGLTYAQPMAAKAAALGGELRVVAIESRRHEIADETLDIILADLRRGRAMAQTIR